MRVVEKECVAERDAVTDTSADKERDEVDVGVMESLSERISVREVDKLVDVVCEVVIVADMDRLVLRVFVGVEDAVDEIVGVPERIVAVTSDVGEALRVGEMEKDSESETDAVGECERLGVLDAEGV